MTRITKGTNKGRHGGPSGTRWWEATTPLRGQTEGDAAGSLDALQHLTHLARQVLDLLEAGQRLLVVFLRREEQQLSLGENRRQRVGKVVAQLRHRLQLRHHNNDRYRSRRW